MSVENKTVAEFQGLRGYAILLIALSHGYFTVNWFYLGGALGVMLFILLSGHLEMAKHGQEGISNLKKFVWNKVRRFYPFYLVTLLLSTPLDMPALRAASIWRNAKILALNMLQLQSWVPELEVYFSYNAVSWYLSLMLFLAVMTPLMLWLVRRAAQANKTLLLLAGITGLEFLWCWRVHQFQAAHWLVYICPLVRLLDFIAGGGYVCPCPETCPSAQQLLGRWLAGDLAGALYGAAFSAGYLLLGYQQQILIGGGMERAVHRPADCTGRRGRPHTPMPVAFCKSGDCVDRRSQL